MTGERIFNGIPLGSSIEAAHGHLYLFKWVFGADKKLEDINFGADIDTYTAALAPYLNAENPDLSAFEKRGGKLIMTLGTADSVVPYHASLDYYERVIEHFGGLEKVQSFFRFYLVPGMAHGGGPGINQPPNLLEAVRAWREKGTAPVALHRPARGEGQDRVGDAALSLSDQDRMGCRDLQLPAGGWPARRRGTRRRALPPACGGVAWGPPGVAATAAGSLSRQGRRAPQSSHSFGGHCWPASSDGSCVGSCG